jgi:hypothetical protein
MAQSVACSRKLPTAVEDRRCFRVDSLVDAEQSDVAGHFDPFVPDFFVTDALDVAVMADKRNFGLVAASPLVIHRRCTAASARGPTKSFLIASEVAQGERLSLNKGQSIRSRCGSPVGTSRGRRGPPCCKMVVADVALRMTGQTSARPTYLSSTCNHVPLLEAICTRWPSAWRTRGVRR